MNRAVLEAIAEGIVRNAPATLREMETRRLAGQAVRSSVHAYDVKRYGRLRLWWHVVTGHRR